LVLLLFCVAILYTRGFLTSSIEVQTVVVRNIHPSQTPTLLNASGCEVAQRRAAVASKIKGRFVSLSVVEGNSLKKDQVIAQLENEAIQAILSKAQANVVVIRRSSVSDVQSGIERMQASVGMGLPGAYCRQSGHPGWKWWRP
jgi:multidrug efflux pump subunit AcrA (membrane-fusion protein)